MAEFFSKASCALRWAPASSSSMTPSIRRLIKICYLLALMIVAYWVLWFAHRSLVASENTRVYMNFEQAFPLADGFIVSFLLLSAWALRRGSSLAVLFLLLGAGSGFYLGGMDVLFDLEHGIWLKGSNGIIELCINIATFVAATTLARFTWRARRALDHDTSRTTPRAR